MRHVSDDERRARLAVRHALATPVDSPGAATRAMTVLHATEPPTVHLSCWARVRSLSVADVDRALYADRTLVKQLAMRRRLFVFPVDLLAAAWPSASARVAATERNRMAQDAVAAGLAGDGHEWLDRARAAVIEALASAPEGLGWKGRDFYLGPHRGQLFDTRGNAGTTAWLNGRAVGCWVQDAAGVVEVRLLEDVPTAGRALLDAEATRLTEWLDGLRVGSVYSSPAMK